MNAPAQLGDVVLVRDGLTGETYAAIVTRLYPGDLADLSVFLPGGDVLGLRAVRRRDDQGGDIADIADGEQVWWPR